MQLSTTGRIRSHMRGNRLWPPAPSTKDGFQSWNTWGDPLAKDNAAGAAVSGSAPQTLIRGFSAFRALPTPVINPPPPMPAMTATASGASSKISRPIVAWPAMKLWSSNGCTNVPATPGNARSPRAFQATAYGTGMRRAPSARILSIFDAGAVSITMTAQDTPACLAAYAMPCPAFPALIVHTPRERSASDNIATALTAPRSLYELVGCRFSNLRRMSG